METPSSPPLYAAVHGSPGARVRFHGLARIYWPFLLVVFLCGLFLQAALPLPLPRWLATAFLASLALGAWAASDRCAIRFGRFLKGARGEEAVARELALLPAGWTIFHGVPSARRFAGHGGDDLDHVALGPAGLFVIETKNWSGPLRWEGGTLFAAGVPIRSSPAAQVRRETAALVRALGPALPPGFPVLGLVCFASNGLESDFLDLDGTPVCNLRALLPFLRAAPPATADAAARARLASALLGRLRGDGDR